MPRHLADIIADFDRLAPSDFNLWNTDACGIETLRTLSDELASLNRPNDVCEIILRFIERLSQSNEIDPRWDLGSPGPLVHTLERQPGFEQHVLASVERSPTPLTLWVINRALNGPLDKQDRLRLLNALRNAANTTTTSAVAREAARTFLEFQERRA